MEAIMDMVSEIKEKHKWLIIGDMVEQGEIEGEEHEKLATALMKVKPEQVILIGRRTLAGKFLVDVRRTEVGQPPKNIKTQPLNEELNKNPYKFHQKYINN